MTFAEIVKLSVPERILLVEDQKKLAAHIARGLAEDGHIVDSVHDGDVACDQAEGVDEDLGADLFGDGPAIEGDGAGCGRFDAVLEPEKGGMFGREAEAALALSLPRQKGSKL